MWHHFLFRFESGAHTIGVTHCSNILNRLYELKNGHAKGMEPGFEAILKLNCPQGSDLTSNSTFVLNDPTTLVFDNLYFINAIEGHGLLRIDAEMVMDPRTTKFVENFANNQDDFFRAFSSAFVKLSGSGALIGNQGVTRKSCNSLVRGTCRCNKIYGSLLFANFHWNLPLVFPLQISD